MATQKAFQEELNPFEIARVQFNRAADHLDLDPSMRAEIKNLEKSKMSQTLNGPFIDLDKKLIRRWGEWQFRKAEWELRKDKILLFSRLSIAVFSVISMGIVLMWGNYGRGAELAAIMSFCSILISVLS
jgi:hypothetical protein